MDKCVPTPAPGVYPFWFWNGEQEESELERQLQLMAGDGNCRGVVLHSRRGNKVEYLSPRWFQLIRHSCKVAQRLGLKIWIYDEDGFPSGNAGGRVQKEFPELQQMALTFRQDYDTVRTWRVEEVLSEEPYAAVLKNSGHVDVFNPRSCQRFLELTHEAYWREVGEFFGNTIEAIYTDDASFLVHYVAGFPYSPFLIEEYEKRYQEDFRQVLPKLGSDLPEDGAIRGRYLRLAEELFLRNWIQPQRQWCQEHGVTFLGHLCGDEGPLAFSLRRCGSIQPFMVNQDVPSIDDYLCDLKDQRYLVNPVAEGVMRRDGMEDLRTTPLLPYVQADSVAQVFAQGKFSVECLTFLGWEVTGDFIQQQMLFELAMGANLFTYHAYYYTVDEVTRNDCPPSYFFQQPGYPIFAKATGVWGRLAELLSQGQAVAKHLVIAPKHLADNMRTKDVCCPLDRKSPIATLEVQLMERLLQLFRRRVSFHIFPEEMVQERQGKFFVGDHEYTSWEAYPGCTLERKFTPTPLPDGADATESEVLIREMQLEDGRRRWYMINLGAEDVPLPAPAIDNTPVVLVEPVTFERCYEGAMDALTGILRQGCAAIMEELPVASTAPYGRMIPLAESPYAPLNGKVEVSLQVVSSDEEKTVYCGVLPAGYSMLEVDTAYCAQVWVDNHPAGWIMGKPHLLRLEESLRQGGEVRIVIYEPYMHQRQEQVLARVRRDE